MIYKIDSTPENTDIDSILREVAKLWDNPNTRKIPVETEFTRKTALPDFADSDDCDGK